VFLFPGFSFLTVHLLGVIFSQKMQNYGDSSPEFSGRGVHSAFARCKDRNRVLEIPRCSSALVFQSIASARAC
jgi:hypothetical protein